MLYNMWMLSMLTQLMILKWYAEHILGESFDVLSEY